MRVVQVVTTYTVAVEGETASLWSEFTDLVSDWPTTDAERETVLRLIRALPELRGAEVERLRPLAAAAIALEQANLAYLQDPEAATAWENAEIELYRLARAAGTVSGEVPA